jgi:hypothetical protein
MQITIEEGRDVVNINRRSIPGMMIMLWSHYGDDEVCVQGRRATE